MSQTVVFKPFASVPSSNHSQRKLQSNSINVGVKIQNRFRVVCMGMLAPRKFLQKRRKMEVFKDVADEKDQKRWRGLMQEIETTGSAVPVLRQYRTEDDQGLPKDLVLGTLIRFKQLKKWNLVSEILEWLRYQNWWNFSEMDFLMLITAYGKLGNFSGAERVLSVLSKMGSSPNVISYTALMESYGRGGKCNNAEAIFRRMQSSGPEPSAVTYQIILKTFVEGNKFKEAEEVFETLLDEKRSPLKPDQKMYHMMIYMYKKAGNYDKARKVFASMSEKGVPQSTVTYNSLMSFETSYKEVSKIYDQMQRSGLQPDVVSYALLIKAYGRARREEEALSVFEEMLDAGVRPTHKAYNILLDAFAISGMVEQAKTVFKSMRRDRFFPDLYSYTTMLSAYVNASDMEGAEKFFKRIKVDGFEPNIVTYGTMIKGYAKENDLDKVVEVYEKMRLSGIKANQTILTTIMDASGRCKDFGSALDWYKEMESCGVPPDQKAKNVLLSLASSQDELEEAKELTGLGNETTTVIARVYESDDDDDDDDDEYETNEDIMLTILKDLRSCVTEPELTEEQLRMNDQLQEDELLALGYIYGGNMFILDQHKDMRYFQIHVNVEATSEYTVSTKLSVQADSSKESEDFLYSFKAQHLPPIVLTCLLPKAYPSHLPPYFLISVQWMNPDKISSLCSMLDSIWMEQPGQEVLYQWTDWLHNSSSSHLGFDNEVVLGPYGITCSRDKRAVSGSRAPDTDIPFIRSYDDEKRRESFLKSIHECSICYSESAGFDFVKLPCQHFFCVKCMKTYTDIHVSEGTVNKLQCPDSKCGEIVPPSVLKRLLGDEAYERWETLMLQKTLDSMTDIAYCPRCETPCIEDEEQLALCFKCYFSFCTLCKEKRHVGGICMSAEDRLQVLQERQSSSRLGEEQRRKEREMINEIISLKVIMKSSKQCPRCNMAIARTGGCNKMVCKNCGQYFCYRCNKAITGYEHFREAGCDLFPQETMQVVQGWDERMNERQLIGQIQAQLFAEHGQFRQRGQLCPNCRQFNAKAGNNNHLFCWACQTHFCYLCKKVVKRGVQHYGPKGCKQHSDG